MKTTILKKEHERAIYYLKLVDNITSIVDDLMFRIKREYKKEQNFPDNYIPLIG